MVPRQQSAGTAAIVAGILLAILFVLYVTSGATMETFADPAMALPYVAQQSGRMRAIALLAMATVALAVIFTAGFAGKLRDRTPTRATGVLYFGLLGLAGHGLGAVVFWSGLPTLVARAAADQVAANHAWVAVNALTTSLDGFGNLFVGLSILLAGWAVTAGGGGLSAMLGWYGVVAGGVTALATFASGVPLVMMGSFVLPIVWLLWAGNALRTA